jgi:four helix bundle protein
MRLTAEIDRSTTDFPKHELYGLSQQIGRAARCPCPATLPRVKVTTLTKEFVRFLLHARGSLLELQTQVLIAEELQYFRNGEGARLWALAEGVGRAVSGLINSMSGKAA